MCNRQGSRQRDGHELQAAARLSATVATALISAGAIAQVAIVQPGAPGQPSREITPQQAVDLASLQHSAADVKFIQGMIRHHAQALDMTMLVDGRTERDAMRLLARRIELSQKDEIAMMQDWLRTRGLEVPESAAHVHDMPLMPGMATAERLAELEQARGAGFDRLFLQLMIEHHRGALKMVENLLEQPGSAQDSVLYQFTADITADQSSEIERMDAMLAGFSPDPRVTLAAGFDDAGEAILNLELVASLPKPPGFFAPENPAGMPMRRQRPGLENAAELAEELDEVRRRRTSTPGSASAADDTRSATDRAGADPGSAAAEAAEGGGDAALPESARPSTDPADERAEPRPTLLNFANTDLVFAGDVAVAGNYHGFNAYDVSDPRHPELLSSVVCPGGQGDVSIVGDLLIFSVEQTRGRVDCGLQGVAEPTSSERFRGIRIFDVSDFRAPTQVGAVQTCRGSHTHTVVGDPDAEGNVYVYVSGTSRVRAEKELEGCSDDSPFENPETALFRIDVVQIPLQHPENARIVNRPFVFADPESGVVAGLWEGGDHGERTQTTRKTDQCHDITAFAEIGLAAGACSGNGILLDITDPVHPVRVHEVIDTGFAYWHSATFSNDGTKVIFTDEWGGGSRPRCRASDPATWGADAIYDIVDRQLTFRGYFKLPAPQSELENCVAHNGALIPVPGRDLFVQAWYQGGISVIDFTDSANAAEIAYFDRGPVDARALILGGYWSAYWYNGVIYGTEIARGLDVLALRPSEHLSENEIAAAALAVAAPVVNPQQQRRYTWPEEPAVARAYVDQLARTRTLEPARLHSLTDALAQAEATLHGDGARGGAGLAAELTTLAAGLAAAPPGASETTRSRLIALAETLDGIAARLR